MKTGSRRATLSFAAGWLTSELALHHIVWQTIATAVFVALGAFESWPGLLGLGISVVSWGALLWCQRLAAQAKTVCEQALTRVFGDDYFQKIRPELRARLSNEVDWRRIARPFKIRRKGVERIRDHLLPLYTKHGQAEDCHIELFDCAHDELPEMRTLCLDWLDRHLVGT